MAIATHELELETTEFLPDREVMTGGGGSRCGCQSNSWFFVDRSNHQLGLVNLYDVNILNGNVVQIA